MLNYSFLSLQIISSSVPLPLPRLWSIILNSDVYLLLLLLMTCPSTGSKIVCASRNFLCHTKIYLEIVPIPIFHSPQPRPLMPCPFTGPKMLCAGPIFLCQNKKYSHIVAVTNILCQTKRWFAFSKNCFLCRHKSFWRGTKCNQIFVLAQKIWTGTKHFGTCKRTRHKKVVCFLPTFE